MKEGSSITESFPSAAPEIPVSDVTTAALYYEKCLGFHWDWGTDGIGQVSRGGCRLFLTNAAYRTAGVARAPVVIWINLDSKAAVDELHQAWPEAEYIVVPDAGHSAFEPGIRTELVRALERFKALLR